MKFMVMHKVTPKIEAALPPSQELIQTVGKLMQEARESGSLVDGAGLRQSATRVRLTFADGKRTIERGPYKGKNELIAGFAMLKVKDMDEAIAWCSHFAKVMGDIEIEVGPITEPWDLGIMPKPADAPLRVLAMHKADHKSEAGLPPSPKLMEEMGRLIEEMSQAGVFIAAEGLAPSAKGARIKTVDGKRQVIDGPFAESKELVSGYVILNLASKAEAVQWALRYADAVEVDEVDVRELN